MPDRSPRDTAGRRSLWSDPRLRGLIVQAVALAAVAAVIAYLTLNTLHNLSVRQIATGFDFLQRQAGFAIGEHLIPYDAADSYFRALVVGLLNTLRVALIGIVLASVLGTLIGLARLSSNWLLAKLAAAYVETFRNIPLLLQLFFWYVLITEILPGPRQALEPLSGVFLSNRGIKIPVPDDWTALSYAAIGLLVGAAIFVALRRIVPRARWSGFVPLLAAPLAGWWLAGGSVTWSVPALQGFNFVGGATMSPEFSALLIGLVVYTSAFIAEIVRGGVLAVGRGQREAAQALGLRRGQALRFVVLPQAMRVIVPPLTSQYLNLTKNSTLAVAIGYPDLVSVAGTTLNQTGQAIESIAIIMVVFLTISLSISLFMNWYNRRIALVER